MTRASLLNILDHATGISEAEVRELEQLAVAFPYCQTAHLLLAKAAHDRGSMLASQRLRRAATYAADRELLRYLIEQPAGTLPTAAQLAPVAAPEPADYDGAAAAPLAPDLPAAPSAPAPDSLATPTEPAAAATPDLQLLEAEPAVALAPEAAPLVAEGPTTAAEAPETEPVAPLGAAPTVTEPAASAAEPVNASETGASVLEDEPAAPAPAEDPAADSEDAETLEAAAAAPAAADPETIAPDAQPPLSAELPAADAAPAAEQSDLSAPEEAADTASAAAQPTAEAADTAEPEDTREPDDPQTAGSVAAAETGSATASTLALTADAAAAAGAASSSGAVPALLPEAADELPPAAPPIRPPVEAGSSRFEFGLGEAPIPTPAYQLPELPAEEPASAAVPPLRADELLAYALSSGSRLGSALTLRDAELTHDLPAAAEWHPDAVALAHLAAHRPLPPPAPSSLALIDRFLRSQPRIKSSTGRPAPTDAPQADLSVRSTSAAPSLASESLAKIMVKQGKLDRAIEIYGQLMQRQPEKKAYFAAQIDLLNQQKE
ncbi:hypothetical protein EJV47_06540 [Hymenobacter gummosus]|uniref:Uncharacterized protein n=1 Tax=Hymenobacter gummosus TaxID=1776032 RepID=A0A431U5J2_9BACT|nr:hypothetical protein [Hymenobacter gummosus]RTQ51456.1 hypothetical protein EJV47_06540 [Hymenobacter gummosus]